MSGTNLDDLARQVNKALRFPKSSSATLRAEFCMNICIVAFGIRAGYLIDSFSPHEGDKGLQRLLTTLRQSSRFEDVRLVYTSEHEQYFFINMPLLRERAKVLRSPHSNGQGKDCDLEKESTIFVLLNQTESLIPPPSDVIETVKQIVESSEDPTPLSQGLTARTLVPLSAFLLEYPVAYVPSVADPLCFLSGVPLDVYECIIVADREHAEEIPKEHTLLKFSCAAHLSASCNSLGPSAIFKKLERLFRGRLELEETLCSRTLKIMHSQVTQDRVAL